MDARVHEDVSLAVLIFAICRDVSSYLEVHDPDPGRTMSAPQLAELALTREVPTRRSLNAQVLSPNAQVLSASAQVLSPIVDGEAA